MSSPSKLWLVAAFFAFTLSTKIGLSQTKSGKELPKAIRVTGCLVKGDEPGEVWLAEKSGKIYGLESSRIELNAHLGRKVMVTGQVLPEGKEEAGEATQNKPGKHESADFRVLALKVIGTPCTQ